VPFSVFCPAITYASTARRYGVGFVLEKAGAHGPQGAVFDQKVGDEDLYRIPDAGLATLVPAPSSGPESAGGPPRATVVPVTSNDPAQWKIVTTGTGPQVLQLHLTAVPGWHATIDGHDLALERYSGVMLQARIPAGRHVVELSYWPMAFTVGLGLAAAGVVGLAGALVVGRRRQRRAISPDGPVSITPPAPG
jgi:hypothetical protein